MIAFYIYFCFSGSIYDLTGSYDLPFFIAGVLLVISSLVSFMVPLVERVSKNKKNPPQNPGVVRDQEMMSEDQESVV